MKKVIVTVEVLLEVKDEIAIELDASAEGIGLIKDENVLMPILAFEGDENQEVYYRDRDLETLGISIVEYKQLTVIKSED